MAKQKKKITVREVEGRRIMLHDNPTVAIAGERSVTDHAHYRRAIARGDLELVEAGSEKKAPKSAAGAVKKEG